MNLPGEWMPPLRMIAVLAIQVTMITAIAERAWRLTRSALWHRAIWHGAALALLCLTLLQVSGASSAVVRFGRNLWLADAHTVTPPAPIPRRQPRASQAVRTLTAEFRTRVHRQLETIQPPTGQLSPDPTASPIDPIEPFLTGPSLPWPGLVWALGAVAVLTPILLARGCFFLLNLRLKEPSVCGLADHILPLASALGIKRRVRVMASARLHGPIAFGILRPRLGVPQDFAERFSPAQQEAMLAHELAHLAGGDPAWQWVADIMASLLWWHPLAWWTRHQLRISAETAADEASLVVNNGPALLAESLLQLASRLKPGEPLAWLGATGSGFRSGLGRRVEKLMNLGGRAWSPLTRTHSGLMKGVVPLLLVLAAIAASNWHTPQNEGDPMNTWKRSLATLALFTGLNAQAAAAPEIAATQRPLPANRAADAPAVIPENKKQLLARYGVDEGNPNASTAESGGAALDEQQQQIYRMDPRLLERYGLKPPGPTPRTNGVATRPGRGKQQIENRLNQIVLNDIKWEGLPLIEVVKFLEQASHKTDPAGPGINFLITKMPETPAPSSNIDPTTGMPIPVNPQDVSSALITLHLRDVRLKDVLDAIIRVADQPVRYSVEEYGVVFSPPSGQTTPFLAQPARPAEARLQVRTFRVDTNTFVAGLDNAFGITVPQEGARSKRTVEIAELRVRQEEAEFGRAEKLHQAGTMSESDWEKARVGHARALLELAQAQSHTPPKADGHDIQQALRQLLQQLGISFEVPGKAVFYNELTGILMVRATAEDLELVQAAIETLGGRPLKTGSASAEQSFPSRAGTVSD